jgi:hypothetical protein
MKVTTASSANYTSAIFALPDPTTPVPAPSLPADFSRYHRLLVDLYARTLGPVAAERCRRLLATALSHGSVFACVFQGDDRDRMVGSMMLVMTPFSGWSVGRTALFDIPVCHPAENRREVCFLLVSSLSDYLSDFATQRQEVVSVTHASIGADDSSAFLRCGFTVHASTFQRMYQHIFFPRESST